jgi:hypothetical protein
VGDWRGIGVERHRSAGDWESEAGNATLRPPFGFNATPLRANIEGEASGHRFR